MLEIEKKTEKEEHELLLSTVSLEIIRSMDEPSREGAGVVRRRRRVARHQREKTPDPNAKPNGVPRMYSDEESSSTNEFNTPLPSDGSGSVRHKTNSSNTAYRNKILSYRDRGCNASVIRSKSTPRPHPNDAPTDSTATIPRNSSSNQVLAFFQQAKRSLSIPRQRKDEVYVPKKAENRDQPESSSRQKKTLSPDRIKNDNETSKIKMNLRRFEEERKRFELEREKFEKEKREIERIRCRRLEEFERKRLLRQFQEAKKVDIEMELQNLSHFQATDQPDFAFRPTVIQRKPSHGVLEEPPANGGNRTVHINGGAPRGTPPLIDEGQPKKQSLLSRIIFGKRSVAKAKGKLEPAKKTTIEEFQFISDDQPITFNYLIAEAYFIWKQLLLEHPEECRLTAQLLNRCIIEFIIISIFFGAGGLIFRFVEGAFENFYKCGVRRVKRDFVDHLWHSSHNLREEDWKSMAIGKLRKFEEELHLAHEAGSTSYSGLKAWTFINAVVYCMTVVTTIGYGHIYPATNTGRAITIVYAIIGIPMFLILLADFGKLFTRGIKFIWAYVRRLYYTGSLRRVRKQAQVQEMLRGMNMAYEIATFRRPSQAIPRDPEIERKEAGTPQSNATNLAPPSMSGTPTTPIPPEMNIDDEFNLPISLAFFILLAYIFFGAFVYSMWEEKWSFFEACYFVFISMSTIGFGDYVPQHPIYMMMSIIYLVFGLALTSMCINVVQVKLSDSFRHATAKIGATIGLSLAEEEARSSQNISPVAPGDLASVHSYGISQKADLENISYSPPQTDV